MSEEQNFRIDRTYLQTVGTPIVPGAGEASPVLVNPHKLKVSHHIVSDELPSHTRGGGSMFVLHEVAQALLGQRSALADLPSLYFEVADHIEKTQTSGWGKIAADPASVELKTIDHFVYSEREDGYRGEHGWKGGPMTVSTDVGFHGFKNWFSNVEGRAIAEIKFCPNTGFLIAKLNPATAHDVKAKHRFSFRLNYIATLPTPV